jgi:hypothetical protein
MKPEGSLPYSQGPVTGIYSERDESSPHLRILFPWDYFNIILTSKPRFPVRSLHSDLRTKIMYAFLVSPHIGFKKAGAPQEFARTAAGRHLSSILHESFHLFCGLGNTLNMCHPRWALQMVAKFQWLRRIVMHGMVKDMLFKWPYTNPAQNERNLVCKEGRAAGGESVTEKEIRSITLIGVEQQPGNQTRLAQNAPHRTYAFAL